MKADPTVLQTKSELAEHCSHHNLTEIRRSCDALLSHKTDLQNQLAQVQQQQQTLTEQNLAQRRHQEAKQQAAVKEALRMQVPESRTFSLGRSPSGGCSMRTVCIC